MNNVDTVNTSTKRKATNLPPVDILFDHLDRVSTKISRVKTTFKAGPADDDSAMNTSTISKGSFRSKKQQPAPGFRQNSLDESLDSDDIYVEGIDDDSKKKTVEKRL